jgi:hypothetical protein
LSRRQGSGWPIAKKIQNIRPYSVGSPGKKKTFQEEKAGCLSTGDSRKRFGIKMNLCTRKGRKEEELCSLSKGCGAYKMKGIMYVTDERRRVAGFPDTRAI